MKNCDGCLYFDGNLVCRLAFKDSTRLSTEEFLTKWRGVVEQDQLTKCKYYAKLKVVKTNE